MRHPVFTDALLDDALAETPRGGVDRWFHQRWLDVWFRAPWWSPYVVWTPAAGWLLASATAPAAARVAALVAGALAWTCIEYALHRWVFHLAPTTDVRRVVTYTMHRHHHADPHGLTRLVATPWQAASVLLPVYALARGLAPGVATDALAGAVLAYLVYEALHLRWHHGTPRTALGRALRAHHLRHHASAAPRAYGISSPLWDWVFGTR